MSDRKKRAEYQREYYRKNREKAKAYQNTYRQKYFVKEDSSNRKDCPDYVREKKQSSYTHNGMMSLTVTKFAIIATAVAQGEIVLAKI